MCASGSNVSYIMNCSVICSKCDLSVSMVIFMYSTLYIYLCLEDSFLLNASKVLYFLMNKYDIFFSLAGYDIYFIVCFTS
jgi:hypothetical protein